MAVGSEVNIDTPCFICISSHHVVYHPAANYAADAVFLSSSHSHCTVSLATTDTLKLTIKLVDSLIVRLPSDRAVST